MNCSKTLFPACAVDSGKNIYYVTHGEHVIKKLDLKTGQVEYLNNPDGYRPMEWSGVDRLFLHRGNLYLLEQTGRRMFEYSLQDKTGKCFEIGNSLSINGNNWAANIVYEDTVFIVSSFANELVKVNLVSNEIEKEKLALESDYILEREKEYYIVKEKEIEIIHRLYSCSCKVETDMWLFTERQQMVLKYDLARGKKTQHILPEVIKGCVHAVWKNGLFYILSIEGNVYSWDFANNKTRILYDGEGENPYPSFAELVVTDKKIWMIPYVAEDIYVVDLENGEKSIFSAYPEDFLYCDDPNRSHYYGYCEDGDNYYFAMHSANYMLIIEKKRNNGKWLRPIEPKLREIVSYYMQNPNELYGERNFGLGFLLMISGQNTLDGNKQEQVGKAVWQYCK